MKPAAQPAAQPLREPFGAADAGPFGPAPVFRAHGPWHTLWQLDAGLRALLLRVEPALPVLAALSGEALYWRRLLQLPWDVRLLLGAHALLGLLLALAVGYRLLRPPLRALRALLQGGPRALLRYLGQAWHSSATPGGRLLRAAYLLTLLLLLFSGAEWLAQRRSEAPLSIHWGAWPQLVHTSLRFWCYAFWLWLVWSRLRHWWRLAQQRMRTP